MWGLTSSIDLWRKYEMNHFDRGFHLTVIFYTKNHHNLVLDNFGNSWKLATIVSEWVAFVQCLITNRRHYRFDRTFSWCPLFNCQVIHRNLTVRLFIETENEDVDIVWRFVIVASWVLEMNWDWDFNNLLVWLIKCDVLSVRTGKLLD